MCCSNALPVFCVRSPCWAFPGCTGSTLSSEFPRLNASPSLPHLACLLSGCLWLMTSPHPDILVGTQASKTRLSLKLFLTSMGLPNASDFHFHCLVTAGLVRELATWCCSLCTRHGALRAWLSVSLTNQIHSVHFVEPLAVARCLCHLHP